MAYWLTVTAIVLAVLALLAVQDMLQTGHAIRRVYPLLGRLRYLVEMVGPELRQYIVTSDLDERPFSRSQRAWVYQASKQVDTSIGFGTQVDTWKPGAFHFLPSTFATLHDEAPDAGPPRVIGPDRPRPFPVRSRINIAPMSFGALSAAAVRALSIGAAEAGCYINTGEGGLAPHHLEGGGDVVFQLGPAKYGARTATGELDWDALARIGNLPQVRAIEVKAGQGAKPGKGGILPGAKVTAEIAGIRGIPVGKPSLQPNRFAEFNDVPSMIAFIEQVKAAVPVPVGLKLVVGDESLLDALAAERAATGRGPDYLSLDGSEGGTGAAPPSLTDHMGLPMRDAVVAADNAYRRHGARDRITLIAAGRATNGADVAFAIALGADLVNIARGFLFSLGCIQALSCHTNECPSGIATQSQWRQRGLVVSQKRERVANYAHAVQEDLMTVVRSCGLRSPADLRREHLEIIVDVGHRVNAATLYPYPANVEAATTVGG
ncbi:MAG: FMN-binding glutamate synthase family protein [Dehalococcoidia bacterium]